MTRQYLITKDATGTDLQITGDDVDEEHHRLHATSDEGIVREAEAIINERFFGVDPFPGFDWKRHTDEWSTTDYDLRAR